MNEVILNVLTVLVISVILPLISVIGGYLTNWLSSKIGNEKAKNLVSKAQEIIVSAVQAVFQTYVDSLKKEGSFDKKNQLIALNKAKDIALNQMTNEVRQCIIRNYGDLDVWLNTKIEATIDTLKNNIKQNGKHNAH